MTNTNPNPDPKRRPVAHLDTPAQAPYSCEQIAAVLPSYHDDTLKERDPRMFGYIRSHLTHCTTCQAADRGLAGTKTPSK